MTGTACEIYEVSEDVIKIDNYDLFSAWLFGKIKAECILQSIDRSGCSLLLPISEPVPSNDIKLIIMSPENGDIVHSIINAKPVRVDEFYTSDNKMVEFNFLKVDSEQEYEIKLLSSYFNASDSASLRCSILIIDN